MPRLGGGWVIGVLESLEVGIVGERAERALRGGLARETELLTAVLDVLRKTGYDGLTIDAVAALAHASKQTVYRRWPSKADLVVAAFGNAVSPAPAPVDTGQLRDDLLVLFGVLHRELTDLGDVISGLVGEQRRNTKLAAAIREGYLQARVHLVREVFERARARGELTEDVELNLVGELAPAMLLFHGLFGVESANPDLPRRLVDELIMPLMRRG